MTEDDLAQVRAALTHDMMEDVWAVANGHTRGGEDITRMREVITHANECECGHCIRRRVWAVFLRVEAELRLLIKADACRSDERPSRTDD